jgi:hypothetical protein
MNTQADENEGAVVFAEHIQQLGGLWCVYAGGGRGNGSMIKLYFDRENTTWQPVGRNLMAGEYAEPPFSLLTLSCAWRAQVGIEKVSSASEESVIEATIKQFEGTQVRNASTNARGDIFLTFNDDWLEVLATVVDDSRYDNYSFKFGDEEWACNGKAKLVREA